MTPHRVLVVEDEGIVAADIQECLSRLGYIAETVTTGLEALKKISECSPDLVLMDIILPGAIDGIETALEIRNRFGIPVVFLTAHADDATLTRAKVAEPFGYIIKPFEEKGLHTIIELALHKHRMDLAEHHHAVQEQELMAVQARQSQKLESIGRLAAGILHEINTPVQYFRDNTRFLRRAFQNLDKLLRQYKRLLEAVKTNTVTATLIAEVEEAERAVEAEYLAEEIPIAITESMEGVERVVKIVQAMKEFAHPGTQKKQPVDLNRAIESTLTVARSEWKAVADVVTEFDAALPPVPCFIAEVNQAILNLIINAAEAIAPVVGDGSRGKGTIAVTTRRLDDWVEIRVRDTGTGIPDSIRDRVFEAFFTTKPLGKGTGQGLAIVWEVIVNRHGGTIRFESGGTPGTTFVIRLPMSPE